MKSALLLLLAATAGCVILFGGSLAGGRFLLDPTWSMDTYHLSLLYEIGGRRLAAGHYPFFFPELAGGYPAPAAWMYGLFYPPTALFAAVPPDLGWSLSATLHLLLAALGMFLFLRRELESEVAASVGAFLFAFSEFMVGRTVGGHLNLVWPMAWVPWTLWAAGRCARLERGGVPLLGLLLGTGLVSGHVQVWFYVAPVLALHALREAARAPSRARAALALLGGVLLAAGVSAVQWVSTAELLSATGGIQVSEELLRDLSVPVPVLAAKLFPGFMGQLPTEAEGGTSWAPGPFAHETVAVGGLAVLLLVVLGCAGGRRGRWLWLGVVVAGLLLAPGRLHPLSALVGQLPPFSLSRAAARALVLVVLGASVLAGHGAAAWLTGPSRGRRLGLAVGVTGGLATAALVGLGVFVLAGMPEAARSARLGATCLPAVLRSVGGLAALLAVLLLVRRWPRAAPLLPLVLLAVLLATAVPPVETTPSDFYFHDWSAALPEEAKRHRVYVVGERFPNLERQGVRGYRLMSPTDVPWYLRVAREGSPRQKHWLDTGLVVDGFSRSEILSGPPRPRPRILSRPVGCGRAVLFARAEVVPDDDVALARLDAGRRELLLAEPAPLPAGAPPEETPGAGRATWRPGRDPNRVRVEVETPVPAYLYASEKYYPGRRATVDGVEVPCVRANVCGVAVPVPAGRHEVVVEYATAARTVGLPVSLVSLVACVAALAVALRRAGRRRGPAAGP